MLGSVLLQAATGAAATAAGALAGKAATRSLGWRDPPQLAVGITAAVLVVVLGYAGTKVAERITQG